MRTSIPPEMPQFQLTATPSRASWEELRNVCEFETR